MRLAWRNSSKNYSTAILSFEHGISSSGCTLYLPLPNSKTLVVWCADKPTILINKGDGVDGAQVTIVLLNHLACPDVPLLDTQRGTEDRREVNKCISQVKKRNIKMNSQSFQNLSHCTLLYLCRALITKINTACLSCSAKKLNMAHCGSLPMRAAINCSNVMNLFNCLNVITAISNQKGFSRKH